jgi:DNA-binding SARP family transcriptional activator/DNA-binding XRE family transcriptional regulator
MERERSEPTAPLANLIRAHRHEAGLTQQELAAKAGISLPALRDLEQGRHSRPRPGSLAALAAALDLDPIQAAGLSSSVAVGRRRLVTRDRDLSGSEPQPGSRQGLWLAVLGPLEASLDGTLLSLGPPARRAVLGLLAADPDAVARRDSIMEALWGQRAPDTAANLVQAHVSRLRKLLMPNAEDEEILVSARGGYRLRLRTDQMDLLTFRGLVSNAEATSATGNLLAACDLYEKALELWRGEPLADLDVLADQPSVVKLKHQLIDALLRYAELASSLGFHERVLPRLQALAAAEPLNERFHARLMIALAGVGQQAAAVRLFEAIRRRLDLEYGIYPGEELVDAHLRVLRQDVPVLGHSYGQMQGGQAVPRQLPAAARYFTGRQVERAMLSNLLVRPSTEAGQVVIAVLTGMAGIGKTALALSWAHQAADRFPDGQLFVDLRGFCSSGAPLDPADALRGFLAALGVPPSRVPADMAGRAALYRSTLASRRVLIVLDNAQNAEQVRPLLPAAPGCLVLVTSRHRLTGLAAADGARLIALGGLTDGESYGLLARLLGTERVIADQGAVGELIGLCARLPLALCNAAARAVARPGLPLATLAAEMRNEQGRLDALETGEAATSVRIVFSLSHAKLSNLASKMFQALGMHPGPEITVAAAAALAGFDRAPAQAALAELCDAHLITEHVPGRYTCHELLRAYAAEAARAHFSEGECRAAVYRMLDYYLHSASAASVLLVPYLAPRTLDQPRQGVLADSAGSVRQAAHWANDERSVLLAVIAQAVDGGFHPHAWELPWVAGWFFSGEECWGKLADAQKAALAIASSLGDLSGAALAHHHLGWLLFWLGDDDAARRHLDGFIDLATRLGGEGSAMPPGSGARSVRSHDGIPGALVQAGRGLGLYRDEGVSFRAIGRRLARLAVDQEIAVQGCQVLTSS